MSTLARAVPTGYTKLIVSFLGNSTTPFWSENMTCRLWTMRTIKASLRTWYLIWYSLCREYPPSWESHKWFHASFLRLSWKQQTIKSKFWLIPQVLIFTFTLAVVVLATRTKIELIPKHKFHVWDDSSLHACLSKWRWNEQRNPPKCWGKKCMPKTLESTHPETNSLHLKRMVGRWSFPFWDSAYFQRLLLFVSEQFRSFGSQFQRKIT